MNKKYIVRLTDQERDELAAVIKRLKGTSQKVRRAQILSKADADGPNWTDHRIAEAFGCRMKTVENVRQRLVERGFRETLDGRKKLSENGTNAHVGLRVALSRRSRSSRRYQYRRRPIGSAPGSCCPSCHTAPAVPRHFDSHANVRSTTQRRGLCPSDRSHDFVSSPTRRMWGVSPASTAASRYESWSRIGTKGVFA